MKYLIAGLGNPGAKYKNTRHNIGFKVLDALCEASNLAFEPDRYAEVCKLKHKGRTLVLIKPQTFMNLSGKAIDYWLKREKIPLKNLLIILDDISLPFGTVRIKDKGGAGGHNGLEDIIFVLKTQKFNRLRFGIGNNFPKGMQSDYVLGEWTEKEKSQLNERSKYMGDAVKSFSTLGIERCMNFFNKKYIPTTSENKSDNNERT